MRPMGGRLAPWHEGASSPQESDGAKHTGFSGKADRVMAAS